MITRRFKLLYSATGIYVLFDGTDQKLTATMTEDFLDLWNEDVYECFFWTDERYPVYFEYEISPLGYELPILIPNFEGRFLGWRPWHYEGDRRTRKKVSVSGGPQESHATVTGWRAEVFIPYDLLKPLQNVPPQPGTRWRANFYRVDYDGGNSTSWDWAPRGAQLSRVPRFRDAALRISPRALRAWRSRVGPSRVRYSRVFATPRDALSDHSQKRSDAESCRACPRRRQAGQQRGLTTLFSGSGLPT